MPFPWAKATDQSPSEQVVAETDSKRRKLVRSIGANHEQPWYADVIVPCKPLGCIDFNLPSKPGLSAGRVLKHARRVLQSIFAKHDPCIFKIGFTHSPSWRWSNSLYGYKQAVDGWTNMMVLYISHEPFGPAMLEAALIESNTSDFVKPKEINICRFSMSQLFFMTG